MTNKERFRKVLELATASNHLLLTIPGRCDCFIGDDQCWYCRAREIQDLRALTPEDKAWIIEELKKGEVK